MIAESPGDPRRHHRTRRSKLIRTAAYPGRANRARLENAAGLWFGRATAGRCVQSPRVSNREVRQLLASLLPRMRKRSGPGLSRVAAARFSVQPRKSRRAFLRCPREYWLDHWVRAEIFRCRTRASALSSPAASAQPFRPSLSAQDSRSSRAQPPVTHALGRSFQLDHRPSRSAEKQRDRRLFRRSGNARLKNYSRSCRRVSRASWLRHLVRNKIRAVLENR